jgi:methionine-rich copper-binding protein CopC
MRLLVIKSRTNADDLRSRLGRTDPGLTLDDIAALNPHVDLRAIEPGTVLLIPEAAADVPTGDSTPLQQQPFDELRDQLAGALAAAAARVRAGHDALAAQAKETTAVLKSAPVKRAIEVDQALQPEIDATVAVFKQDAAHAKTADQALKGMQKQIAVDLSALQKLLG